MYLVLTKVIRCGQSSLKGMEVRTVMHFRSWWLKSSLLLICSAALVNTPMTLAQMPGVYSGPPPSPAEVLAENGITRREQVVQALTKADPVLRSTAALRLGEEKDPEAVQLIRNALETEQDPAVIVNFSSELWSLGIPEGEIRLEAFCQGNAATRDTLVRAARQLSFRHKGGMCAMALVHAYRDASTSSQEIEVLQVLQAVAIDVSPLDKPGTFTLASEASRSPNLEVRVEARHLLRIQRG